MAKKMTTTKKDAKVENKKGNEEPPFKFQLEGKTTSGVVTLSDWGRMPTGEQHNAIWAERWVIIPDKAVPLDGFKSAEHWSLAAVVGDDVLLLIPGCKVHLWAYCEKPPKHKDVYVVK